MIKEIVVIISVITVASILSHSIFNTVSSEAEPLPVKIAINEWPGYSHAIIAQEKGFFEKNNVNVELIFDRDYYKTQDRFKEAQVDGAFQVFSDSIHQRSDGLPLRVVQVMDYSNNGDVIIGTVSSINELEGKTIGIEGLDTFSHMFIVKTLEKHGMSEKSVRLRSVLARDVAASLDEGLISAGHTWEPTKSIALKKGYKLLASAGDFPYLITDVLAFHEKVIEQRPKDVENIVRALFESSEFQKNNPDEAAEIISKFTGTDKDIVLSGFNDILLINLEKNYELMNSRYDESELASSYRTTGAFYFQHGIIKQIPDYQEIIEPKFINKLTDNE
jgi:NitT/TauT family transport system substrate-binding protein